MLMMLQTIHQDSRRLPPHDLNHRGRRARLSTGIRVWGAGTLAMCVAAGVAEARMPAAGLQSAGVPAASPLSIAQPAEGDCIVRVDVADPAPTGLQVEIDLNKQPISRHTVGGRRRIEVWIRGPLEEGDELRVR